MFLASGPNAENNSHRFPIDGRLDVKRSITVLCWVYLNSAAVSVSLVTFGKVRLGVRQGSLVANYTSEKSLSTDKPMTPNKWHYVGSSYDHNSGIASLWVNGTRVKNKTIGARIVLATDQHVRIGGMGISSDPSGRNGRIAAMQVYDVALTEDKINAVKYADRGMN